MQYEKLAFCGCLGFDQSCSAMKSSGGQLNIRCRLGGLDGLIPRGQEASPQSGEFSGRLQYPMMAFITVWPGS